MFTAVLFKIAKKWKESKCPSMDRWIKKICTQTHKHPHIHTQILPSHKEMFF